MVLCFVFRSTPLCTAAPSIHPAGVVLNLESIGQDLCKTNGAGEFSVKRPDLDDGANLPPCHFADSFKVQRHQTMRLKRR